MYNAFWNTLYIDESMRLIANNQIEKNTAVQKKINRLLTVTLFKMHEWIQRLCTNAVHEIFRLTK